MDKRGSYQSVKGPVRYGKRLLPSLVDERARQGHQRPYASIPVSNNIEDGYRDITYQLFNNAVNRMAQRLIAELGPSTTFEPIIYMGPPDLRYQILAIAAPKAGYSMCFTSPRNTVEAQLSLVDASRSRIIASPARQPVLVTRTSRQRQLMPLMIPELDALLDEMPVSDVPFDAPHDYLQYQPWIMLQGSDSSGRPNLVTLKHDFASSFDTWSYLSYNDADHRYGERRVFCSMPCFHITGLVHSIIFTIWLDSTLVLPPPYPLTADNVNKIHVHSDVAATLLPASLITELAQDSLYRRNLLRLKSITYSGSCLPKQVGDLLAPNVALAASITSPEIGGIPILPSPPSDWEFTKFNLELGGLDFRKSDLDDDSYELIIVNTGKESKIHPVFSTYTNIKEYATGHLFSPHRREADLWKYKGRADNAITLEDGEEFNPEAMEYAISSSPLVKACMVVGQDRPRPCLLVELDRTAASDDSRKIEARVWPEVDRVNRAYTKAAQIQRNLILFTYPDIPLPRDAEGHIKRLDALQIYRPDINTLYNDWNEAIKRDVGDLDFDTVSSTMLSIQFLLRKHFNQINIDTSENFLQRGMDSIDVLTLVRFINSGRPPTKLEVKDVFENPTARGLAQHLHNDESRYRSSSIAKPDAKSFYTMQQIFDEPHLSDKSLPPVPRDTLKARIVKFLNKKDNHADEPPDGGLTAWLQVFGCFCIFMNNWGLAAAFGVFQAYYKTGILADVSESRISWIGTIQASFTLLIGVASGPLFDRGLFFQTLMVASVLMVFSFMMLSLSTEYYQILLTQGVLQGICAGLLYIPSVAQIPQYFVKKRGLALGLVTAGAPFGGVVYPLILREVITKHGFPTAARVMGGVAGGFLVMSWIVIKPLILANRVQKKLWDPDMFRDPPYLSFLAASFLLFCGMLTPYILSATYYFRQVEQDYDMAFYSVAIINAGNFFGRIIPAAMSDRGVGPEYLLLFCNFAVIILGFTWTVITSKAGYLAFLVLYGFFSGGIAALPAACLPYICPSLEVFATRLGLVYAAAGIGVLIGTPISTAIDATRPADNLPYLGSQLWVGITMAVGIIFAGHAGYIGSKRRKVIVAERLRAEQMKKGGMYKA